MIYSAQGKTFLLGSTCPKIIESTSGNSLHDKFVGEVNEILAERR